MIIKQKINIQFYLALLPHLLINLQILKKEEKNLRNLFIRQDQVFINICLTLVEKIEVS